MEGDGQALFSIGYIYDIQKQEYAKAMEWYLLSAKANHPGAQNNIGNMYYMGSGMPVDYLLALEWYLKAAVQKNKFAFENIGRIFEKGLGVRDDKYMALEWYRRNKHTAEAAMKLKDKGYHVPPHKKSNLGVINKLDLMASNDTIPK
jgi:TPR repeat protein